ncbi:putative HTH-type transcriptional regulator [Alphaproteobacteria bacterium]|nr:putative HTH-type transcriptional regulator [Alphaproteobacteria bacterium]
MSRNKAFPPAGADWDDLRVELLTPEERAETDVKIALLSEIINARTDNGLTQKQLEEISGVKQPVIARLERGTTDPQLSTMIRILASMGKTLAVIPLKN